MRVQVSALFFHDPCRPLFPQLAIDFALEWNLPDAKLEVHILSQQFANFLVQVLAVSFQRRVVGRCEKVLVLAS